MRHIFLFIFLTNNSFLVFAQSYVCFSRNQIIQTAMPFLSLQSDARASAMANIGGVSTPDVFSQNWNSAKYAFIETDKGLGISYVPYMNKLTNDVFLGNITYFSKRKKQGVWATSLNYFRMGDVEFSQVQAGNFASNGFVKPNELTFDISYNLKLSEKISMGVTGRWLHSNLRYSDSEKQVANSVSVSISSYYQSDVKFYNKFDAKYRIGVYFSNIGPKIKYEEGGVDFFIPTNLKIGFGYDFLFKNENSISFLIEANKLLVPTPPLYGFFDKNNDKIQNTDEPTIILRGKNNKISFFEGIFQSFSDAPNGLSEELKEISLSTGIEYRFLDSFSLGCGYFYEHKDKGGRNNLTIGAGFKYQNIRIYFSYLFSMSSIPNPMENALRVSGSYEISK